MKVTTAARFLNRQASRVAKNVYKSLTELITNSDDSYARLAAANEAETDDLQEIWVIYDQAKKEFQVVDHAEGMTDETMAENFGEYGKDTSGSSAGVPVRGLFGQGISDVLFYHQKGQVQSIVERTLYKCPFIKDRGGDWFVDPKRTRATVNSALRQSLRIPEGNGTVVSFELAPLVSKPVRRFVDTLQRFYMLRLITSDPNKKVCYIEIDKTGREKRHELHYEFPTGDLLTKQRLSFDFENYSAVEVELELRRSGTPLDAEEGGLLVFDEKKAVYDRTLFGCDYPGSERLFGTIRLTGAREIILKKMNQDQPEEILSDDRNGFDRNHPFYQALQSAVKPIIDLFIERQAPEPRQDNLPERQRENQRKALDLFDELYKDMVEDITLVAKPRASTVPPPGGLEFDRRAVTATERKSYGLGININTSVVPVGSVVSLETDNDSILVKPASFEVTREMTVEGLLARRFVTISGSRAGESGLIRAAYASTVASAVVTIAEETFVYPESLCFAPSSTTVCPEATGRGLLFVNTDVIPVGSVLRLTADDETTEIVLDSDQLEVSGDDIAYEEVARLRVVFLVGEKKGHGQIRVSQGGHETALAVRVVKQKPDEPEAPQAKFTDWRFEEIGRFQCFYDSQKDSRTCGCLVVNKSHPLNLLYLGDEPTKETVNESMVASSFLAELLLDAALDYMSNERSKQERVSGGDPMAEQDPHLYIRRYHETEKAKIGPQFHQLFIDEALMQEYEREVRARSSEPAE